MLRRGVLLWAVLLAAACATPSVVETAYYGDLAALKAEIAAAQRAGELDRGSVSELAEAVARREVRSARGTQGVERIRQARGCVGALRTELAERAEAPDDGGAQAALVLLERGLLGDRRVVARYARASSGSWRAVAARATGSTRYGLLRRRMFEDPDERVRRAALRAALELADVDDLEELLEAARLDPDPLARSVAARAVGAIGGEPAVLGLKDLWASAQDEDDRLPIVEAWAQPASLGTGGRGQLRRLIETGSGLPKVAAAAALHGAGGQGADSALRVLVRAAKDGTTAERSLGIRRVPLSDAAALKAVRHAAKESGSPVAPVALARLLDHPPDRKAARDRLRELAKGRGPSAHQARIALAAVGDAAAAPLLKRDLAARWAARRQRAALGLVDLGRYSDAATALGDDDSAVRMAVACGILGRGARR